MSKNNSQVKRSWFFIILLTVIALALAGTAAYFSIFGLSKLFVGAGVGIIILASVLEAAKLTAVSYVYRYWKYLAWGIKSYFVTGIVVVMLITSLGIYGYLTSSYQKTANKVEYRDSQVKIAENKKSLFIAQADRINKAIESDNNRVNQLSNIRGSQERRLDSLYSRKQNRSFTEKSINTDNEQIKFLNEDITAKMKQYSSANDSIAYYDNLIVTLKTSDVSNEVGPLKFISDFTGWSMSKVVNILVLLLIFVFDPMAIVMLISVNQLTMMESDKESEHHKDVIKVPFLKRFRKEKDEEETEYKEEEIEPMELYSQDKPVFEEPQENVEKLNDVNTSSPLKLINLDKVEKLNDVNTSSPLKLINLDKEEVKNDIEEEQEDEVGIEVPKKKRLLGTLSRKLFRRENRAE